MTEPLPAGLGAAAELAESGMAGTCAMRGGSDELAEPGGVPGPASGADDDLPGGSDEPVGHGDPPAAASNVSLRPSDAPTGLSLGDETDDGTVDNLPTGWRSTTLGEVAVVVRDRIDPSESGPLAYLGLEHLVSGRRSVHAWGSTEGVKSTVTPFWAGDTLFGRLRPYLRKGCAAPFGGACTTEILVLRALESVDARFLSLLVLNDRVFNECMHMSTGTRMPRVSAKNLMGITVLVPPLEEQRRIVEVVEELLSRLDAAEGRVADARAKLDQLERSILHEALTPPRGTASDLLTEREDAADPAAVELAESGHAGGWRSTTLGEVARYDNGFPFKPAHLDGSQMPVIRIRQLLDESEIPDRTDSEVPLKHHIDDGDVVFSWSGTLAVRIWDRGPALLNQHLFRVVPATGVYSRWLALALDNAIEALMAKSHGTTMKHITKKVLHTHELQVPPLEEQRRIVEMVEERLARLEPLKQAVDSASEQAASLRRSILAAALCGRLTSQERAA